MSPRLFWFWQRHLPVCCFSRTCVGRGWQHFPIPTSSALLSRSLAQHGRAMLFLRCFLRPVLVYSASSEVDTPPPPIALLLSSRFFVQLAVAFGATDITETLSIAGTLASLDEYWSSELCFKMVSRMHTYTTIHTSTYILLEAYCHRGEDRSAVGPSLQLTVGGRIIYTFCRHLAPCVFDVRFERCFLYACFCPGNRCPQTLSRKRYASGSKLASKLASDRKLNSIPILQY